MTYIADLIKEHFPNGVEWKELGDREVAKLSRGKVMSKQFLEENKGVFPVYSSQTANSGEIGKISTFDFDGEYITWTTDGANAGTVFYRKGKFSITNVCGLVDIQHDKLLTKFVYYYLTITTKKYVSSGMGNPKLMSNVMAKIKIPIPPLEIQEEIVKILDKFTEYVTELTAELTDRQKQYSFYRDKLLSFEDEVYQVEWKTLGEKEWYGGENSQPFVQVADISENGYCLNASTQKRISQKAIPKSVFVPKGTVLVTLQGTIGRVAITQYDVYVDRTIAIFDDYKCDIDTKYFAYQLKRKFDIEKEFARGSTLKTITKQEFSQFQIPIPPLSIQQRIVEVLDNFDAVCNDLNIGLPKEIELRQKQYEYFREKLLTFTAEGVYPGQWTVSGDRPT